MKAGSRVRYCALAFPLVASILSGSAVANDEEYLSQRLDQVRRRFQLNRAIGVEVVSLVTGETIYSHNSSKKFIPASGMKLVTIAAALHYLGPNYRFETRLLVDGPVVDGVAKGSLYIQGSGDPALTNGDLQEITAALSRSGIRAIDGDLILDDSFFDDQLRGPASYDNILKKGLPIQSALSYNFNIVEVTASPSEIAGTRANLFDGGYGYFEVLNQVTTAGRGRPWLTVRKSGGRDRVIVSGRVIAGDEELKGGFVAPDPPRYLASAFVGKLQEHGVSFHGDVRKGVAGAGLNLLYVHRSAPLIQIVEHLGKNSNNFVAEQVLKALGAHRWGAPGSFESGSKALSEYLMGLGHPKDSFRIDDGSGLSYENHLSASILVDVLEELYRMPELRTDFLCALAVGGVDGTLARRFRNEEYLGRVIAKTGSLAGISSLSGFAFSEARGPVVFSVVLNGVSSQWRADQVEDEIAKTLLIQ
ncbi:MAG TPA: D-alanyl-D-alanine carboxypeptidase/D-alanyl-D-alanine-endopeptidase [Vicinamibacteria bacterium]|jgi:D-alanyl-D-alanine carboxypeptidase/D-alanyl-D-alanine-endopeptidase (penicillin-binding protein 4)